MPDSNQNNLNILSVSELNNSAKRLLEKNYSAVWIKGEVSNFRSYDSGHWYFKIKDDSSEIQCVMFRFRNSSSNMQPIDGDQLILNGSISMYLAKGTYQFQVDSIEYAGEGVLLKNFEILKNKLNKEGFFEESHKLEIPLLPKHIGVITSTSGVVIEDIRNVLSRRAPLIEVSLIPSLVQGDGSEDSLLNAILKIDELHRLKSLDIVIFARGGGSLEDLWSFNSEKLAKEIFKLNIPTISAIGHETDFTICDFVSDLRAPTPSAAAEIISEGFVEKKSDLKDGILILVNSLKNQISYYENKLNVVNKSLINPKTKIYQNNQKLDELKNLLKKQMFQNFLNYKNVIDFSFSDLLKSNPANKILVIKKELEGNINLMNKAMQSFVELRLEKFSSVVGEMNSLSPLNVLSRGYSISKNKKTDKIIRSKKDINLGDVISTKASEISFESKVTKTD